MAKEANMPNNVELFDEAINRYEYRLKLVLEDYSILKDERYRKFYYEEPLVVKIKIMIKRRLRFIYTLYNRFRKEN